MKTYDTPEAKAARILTIYGKAPRLLRGTDPKEVAALAALVNDKGEPVDGAREMFDSILLEHYKATDADKEAPAPDVAAQQKAQQEAAKLLAAGKIDEPAQPEQVESKGRSRKPKGQTEE